MRKIIRLISTYQPIEFVETSVASAVLIILIADKNAVHDILLMKRPAVFSSYAGDFCFPGGIKEAADKHLKQTALRETQEEIGLKLNFSSIIGQLDDFKDKKGRLVRPFVALVDSSQLVRLKMAEAEVEKVCFLSLTEVKNYKLDIANIKPSIRKPSYIFQCDTIFIWGLTAAILVHLSNLLNGSDEPVGHCCFL